MSSQGLQARPSRLVSSAPPAKVKRDGASATNALAAGARRGQGIGGRRLAEIDTTLWRHSDSMHADATSAQVPGGRGCLGPGGAGPPPGATTLAAMLVVSVASTSPTRAAAMPHTPCTRDSRAMGSLMAEPNSTTVAAQLWEGGVGPRGWGGGQGASGVVGACRDAIS